MPELLTIEEAQKHVLEHVRPLTAETVPVEEAAGRVLAEPACSAVDLPPFASSAMDGFALRAVDAPATLRVVGRIAAGRPADRALATGEAMGIATGAAVPDGADAVIPLEYVGDNGNTVEIAEAVSVGDHIRPSGGDVRAGDVVLEPGILLGPAQIGAAAASGLAELMCARRPAAAVLATGTELRRPGEELGPGEIYEANGLLLAAALAAAGAAARRLTTVQDDEEAHREALREGLEADLLVTSGGVSVGPHDLVRRIERELGVEEVFWGVSVKPGKPVSFGVRDGTLVFGLPGNPVSALVGFVLFVRPAVLALQGLERALPEFEPGRLAQAVGRSRARDQLVRARIVPSGDGFLLAPVEGQESHMIARAAAADALVLVPRGEGDLAQGAEARFLRLS